MKKSARFFVILFAVCFSYQHSFATVLHVTVTGAGAKNGTSWANAFEGLQPALSVAVSGDQIWVAKGTYKPSYDYGLGGGSRYYHFRMIEGTGLYGGFAGTETDLSQRSDFGFGEQNETILSGDIGIQGNNSDNCLHIFYHPEGMMIDNPATYLDGFTFTGGNANSSSFHQYGGAIMNGSWCLYKISNCYFTANSALFGGAIFNFNYSSPVIDNCHFVSNTASQNSGAIYNWFNSSPQITNCSFISNSAQWGAGALGAQNAASPKVTNCTFISNSVSSVGGAISIGNSPNTLFINCTFNGNSANLGGAIYTTGSTPEFVNCIIWGNTATTNGNQFYIENGTIYLDYSCYSNGTKDVYGNLVYGYRITTDPLFAGSTSNPGHPFSILGISPCADAGYTMINTQPYDIRGEGFSRNLDKSTGLAGTIDMGAYEYKSAADSYDFLIWTGTTDSDWGKASNWNPARLPVALADVNIPSGLANYPTLTNPASCHNITLLSNSVGTATLIDNGYLSVTGTTRVNRYFSGNGLDWHLVSSPLSNGKAGVFLDMYLQKFFPQPLPSPDPPFDLIWYEDIVSPYTPLTVMEGYALYSTLAVENTVTFAGNLNTGTKSHALLHNDANATYGWNLLGNPFPSSIDWDLVSIPSGMSNEVHYIDAASGNDLSYVQSVGGTGSRYIPPMQGFFVSAPSATSFSLGDAQRTHSGSSTFYKSDNPKLVVLNVSGSEYSDQVWIHFNEQAGSEHDNRFDAYKRISLSNPKLPQIFAYTQSGEMLSVDGLPEITPVNLGFTAVDAGQFTIDAFKKGDFTGIELEDLLTGIKTELKNNAYTFNFNPGDTENRFILRFKTVGIQEPEPFGSNIYSYDEMVFIDLPVNVSGDVYVYNLSGQTVASRESATGQVRINLTPAGVYMVKVVTGKGTFTEKVWIR